MYSCDLLGSRLPFRCWTSAALRLCQSFTAASQSSANSASARLRARVFAALGARGGGRLRACARPRLGGVGAGGRQPLGGSFRPQSLSPVKRGETELACRWIAADFVQREQALIAIKGCVLHRLRHQRPGELLKLERELARARRAVTWIVREIEGNGAQQKIEYLRIRPTPSRAGAGAGG